MKPTIGRIVHYRLTRQDAESIATARMMSNQHRGNDAHEGDVYPALIVRVHENDPARSVNLQVFVDGPDVYWVTSIEGGPAGSSGSTVGRWVWPIRVGAW